MPEASGNVVSCKVVCRHCKRPMGLRRLGLCYTCYFADGVRELYKTQSPNGRRGASDAEAQAELVRLRRGETDAIIDGLKDAAATMDGEARAEMEGRVVPALRALMRADQMEAAANVLCILADRHRPAPGVEGMLR